MLCSQCNSPLKIAGSKFESSVDSTDVYSVLTMVCINPKCPDYSGADLNNPLKSTTVRNKV